MAPYSTYFLAKNNLISGWSRIEFSALVLGFLARVFGIDFSFGCFSNSIRFCVVLGPGWLVFTVGFRCLVSWLASESVFRLRFRLVGSSLLLVGSGVGPKLVGSGGGPKLVSSGLVRGWWVSFLGIFGGVLLQKSFIFS